MLRVRLVGPMITPTVVCAHHEKVLFENEVVVSTFPLLVFLQ